MPRAGCSIHFVAFQVLQCLEIECHITVRGDEFDGVPVFKAVFNIYGEPALISFNRIDLSDKLLIIICDLDYEWSVLVLEVNALVYLSEGSTVNKSGNGEPFFED